MSSFWDGIFGNKPIDPFKDRVDREVERLTNIDKALDGPYGNNHTLYEATARLFRDANFPTADKFARQTILRLCDRCEELGVPQPHDAILLQMVGAAAGVYAAERFDALPPNPADYFYDNANPVVGQLRDLLIRQQVKALDPTATLQCLSDTLVASFLIIARQLPPIATDGGISDGIPTIPLVDCLPDTGRLIEDALEPFFAANQYGLFRWLRDTLTVKAELVSQRSRSKRPIPPSEHDGSPFEVAQAYVGDTPFERVFEARLPFDIALDDRGEHTAIVAGSGWGKTQLLQNMIASDLEEYEEPPAMVILDSTGAMVRRIQHLAVFNERLKDRLLIIDPELNPVPALNPFDLSNSRFADYAGAERERMQGEVIDLFNYVFSTIKNPLTTRMETAFAFMVRLLLSISGADIHTLLDLLDDAPPKGDYSQAKFKAHIDKLDTTTQQFFRSQYYTGHSDALREQLRARVFDILRVPAFERMFSGVNKVDFFTELNRGSIILVNTSENLLKDGSATFGRYIVARVMAAAFERAPIPPEDRRPAFLIVDEAAPYFDEVFEKLLNRVRQFKLGVVIAFQNLEQASEKLRSTIASSTAIKYAGGTGYSDSRWLANEMRCEQQFILSRKRDGGRPPKWSQFACYVRNSTDRAVSLTVPFYTLENMPKMTDQEHSALLERNHARVAAAPPPAPEQMSSAPPSEPEPALVDPMTAALAKAYADLSEALGKSDWERVSELKNGIIPTLERNSRSPEPRPIPASHDEARPVATGRDEPRPSSANTEDSSESEGTTNWRL